ncbi:GFA family protein [Aureimonas leprariae]|uniref:GFA family protein n=1 Tax=Plantimonas leprariae TaxID=2615207 RepID=A0A7V7PKQ8_9HYPH|nr:GFA family protein [Aureimonas leprariae]KAB0676560.1 GFA family protein [Aureimonas leprariae]
MTYTGGCQCGRVRYEASGEPNQSDICECRMCQRASGGLVSGFAQFDAGKVRWLGAQPKPFRSSSVAERDFCPDCGTTLTYRHLPKSTVSVTLASLDDPDAIRPIHHNGIEGRASWFADAVASPGEASEPMPDGAENFQHRLPGGTP